MPNDTQSCLRLISQHSIRESGRGWHRDVLHDIESRLSEDTNFPCPFSRNAFGRKVFCASFLWKAIPAPTFSTWSTAWSTMSSCLPRLEWHWHSSLPGARPTLAALGEAVAASIGGGKLPVMVANTCSASLASLPVVAIAGGRRPHHFVGGCYSGDAARRDRRRECLDSHRLGRSGAGVCPNGLQRAGRVAPCLASTDPCRDPIYTCSRCRGGGVSFVENCRQARSLTTCPQDQRRPSPS